jgi:hypothetical protein
LNLTAVFGQLLDGDIGTLQPSFPAHMKAEVLEPGQLHTIDTKGLKTLGGSPSGTGRLAGIVLATLLGRRKLAGPPSVPRSAA